MTPTVPSPEGLRYDYEQSLLSLAMIEAKYGLSRKEITDFRIAESWTARGSSMAALKAYKLAADVHRLEIKSASVTAPSVQSDDHLTSVIPAPVREGAHSKQTATQASSLVGSADIKPKRAPSKTGGTPKHRKTLIERLYDVFDAKVAEIEERIATQAPLARPDNESEVRQFGQLIKYFESLTDLSDAELTAARATASDTSRDDAERLRNNLVARIEKLRPPSDQQPTLPTLPS